MTLQNEIGVVKFFLKNPKSLTSSLLVGKYLFKHNRITFSTGYKIDVKNWDQNKQLVSGGGAGKKEINAKLNIISTAIIDAHKSFNNDYNRVPDEVELKALVNDAVKNDDSGRITTIRRGKKTFADVYNEIIEQIDLTNSIAVESAKNGVEIKGYNRSHRTSYQNMYTDLNDFANAYKLVVDLDKIDENFALKFREYLAKKGMAVSTIETRFKRFKSVLSYAFKKGYTNNRSYMLGAFLIKVPPTISLALTDKEIDIIYEFDLSSNKTLERVRDMFILACHSGLRISDVSRIEKNHFNIAGKSATIFNQKTSKSTSFGWFGYTEQILKKYDYNIKGIALSTQKTNQHLKTVFGMIEELKDKTFAVEVATNRGVQWLNFKYMDKIEFHTGRRSFCTNRYIDGWEISEISKYTGHSDEQTFRRYFRPTSEHERIRKANIEERNRKLNSYDIQAKEMSIKDKQIEQLQIQLEQLKGLINVDNTNLNKVS